MVCPTGSPHRDQCQIGSRRIRFSQTRRKPLFPRAQAYAKKGLPYLTSWRFWGLFPFSVPMLLTGLDRQDALLGGGVARRFTRSEDRPTGKSTLIPLNRLARFWDGEPSCEPDATPTPTERPRPGITQGDLGHQDFVLVTRRTPSPRPSKELGRGLRLRSRSSLLRLGKKGLNPGIITKAHEH